MGERHLALSAEGGQLLLGARRFRLKGLSWFGFETPLFVLHGLWQRPLGALLDFAAGEGFNTLRLPLSAEFALAMDAQRPGSLDEGANPALKGLTSGQVLDEVVREAGQRGLLVMFDMHHLTAAGGITELWYDSAVPEERLCQAWTCVIARYGRCWNFFAADLKNEPHGAASWGTGDRRTDWRLAAERLGSHVLRLCPRLLIFVEGVQSHCRPCQAPEACFWGSALCSAAARPVRLPLPGRLVYSPHTYGPGVHMQDYFRDPAFPANMPGIWDRQWGCAREGGAALVLGEWGGRFGEGSQERAWAEALVAYLRQRGTPDAFFWCLNPNSGDTGGLLEDDWATPVGYKLDVLRRLCPEPTRVQAPAGVQGEG